MGFFRQSLDFISTIADTHKTSQEEKLQHSFLIYMGLLMSVGGLLWGSISFFAGLKEEAFIPYSYAAITLINFTYLYKSKNFQVAQSIQIFISLLLPFIFQFVLGGFFASGGVIWWSILSILAGFAFQNRRTSLKWFLFYLIMVICSAIFDGEVFQADIEVPKELSILFFAMNITWISIIIYTLFYYFVDTASQHRASLQVSQSKLKDALAQNQEYLKTTQNQLIESEKMSALGNMVAGVAHEVNTPLGVSITAASIFKEEIRKIQIELSSDELTRSSLDNFIKTISEADTILVKNLARAAELIKNFKQISVDQSSEAIREFGLNEYIEEIVSTFKSEFKHRPIEVKLRLSKEEVEMKSHPGALSQVIVNMLQNTLFHAFDADDEGEMVIETIPYENDVLIRVSDNGKGVDKNIASKIFEPFVTSKRKEGGTGLGLSITHTLVTELLKGSIDLDRYQEKGTAFLIKIPNDITVQKG